MTPFLGSDNPAPNCAAPGSGRGSIDTTITRPWVPKALPYYGFGDLILELMVVYVDPPGLACRFRLSRLTCPGSHPQDIHPGALTIQAEAWPQGLGFRVSDSRWPIGQVGLGFYPQKCECQVSRYLILIGPKPKEIQVEPFRIDYLRIRTPKVEKLSLQPIRIRQLRSQHTVQLEGLDRPFVHAPTTTGLSLRHTLIWPPLSKMLASRITSLRRARSSCELMWDVCLNS